MSTQERPVSILPLSPTQLAMLISSLNTEGREGLLQVEFTLEGDLDASQIRAAWEQVVKQHEALRSTIHWKDIEKPVQVVRRSIELPFEHVDLSDKSEDEFEEYYQDNVAADAKKPLQLDQNPPMRFRVFQKSPHSFHVLWTCHHVILDGWSSSIVVTDLVKSLAYPSSEVVTSESLKTAAHKMSPNEIRAAGEFWKNELGEKFEATLLSDTASEPASPESISHTSNLLAGLSAASRAIGVTPASLVHAAWSTTIASATGKTHVVSGTVVSGRSGNTAGIENTAGMFSKTLPYVSELDGEERFRDMTKRLQRHMAEARRFEFFDETAVIEQLGLARLFDSLVVFENIPFEKSESGAVRLTSYKSGLASGYAVTVAVLPIDPFEIRLVYKPHLCSHRRAELLLSTFVEILEKIVGDPEILVRDLLVKLERPAVVADVTPAPPVTSDGDGDEVTRFENDIRLIWEEVLNVGGLGVNDDFFDIGGRSLDAVRIFGLLKERLQLNASPVMLVENRSVRELARALQSEEQRNESWSTIVPLRGGSSRNPLFCLHGGGGHVLFYRPLASHMDSDQPVFGIQPVGIDGEEEKLESVEEMATRYIEEARTIQPEGPLSFLGYCFSSTVAVEIGKQEKAAGKLPGKLIVVDSPPMHLKADTTELPGISEKLQSYYHLISSANWTELKYRIGYKAKALKWKMDEISGAEEEIVDPTLAESKDVLAQAYKDYVWDSFDLDLNLIMAGPVEARPYSKVIVGQWKSVATGNVGVEYIDADHATIFESPSVVSLARAVQKCLDELR